jgi:CMP-N,N'-diacetyllegionaminic acid synthase
MLIYVDIDETICNTNGMSYENSTPIIENIKKINQLYDDGNEIVYWSARGSVTKINWEEITLNQLKKWGCKFKSFSVGKKPPYDLLICDKTKRIEEI